ncbi:hypothetical protein MAR_001895 [Mya arenaria]|uniref:Uncharacterized protein n=1 Tax=Mya arenaria TaxID=6604 RepID=A0ABY7FEQ1_MYAAR|nr:hypothetical protein MAR_001895 [Mya arenaria]
MIIIGYLWKIENPSKFDLTMVLACRGRLAIKVNMEDPPEYVRTMSLRLSSALSDIGVNR